VPDSVRAVLSWALVTASAFNVDTYFLLILAAVVAGGAAGLVLISTVEASTSSTLTLTGITSTYDMYLVSFSDMIVSNDAVNIYYRMGDSSGIDSASSDYAWIIQGISGGAASSSAEAQVRLCQNSTIGGVGNGTGEGWNGVLWQEYSQAAKFNTVSGVISTLQSSTSPNGMTIQGHRNTNIILTQVQVLMEAGTITSGRMSLFGVAHA